MQTNVSELIANIGDVAIWLLRRGTGGDSEKAAILMADSAKLATALGMPAGEQQKIRRPRTPKTAADAAAAKPPENARKIKLQEVPAILAERFPGGASEEEVRGILGWSASAPMASFHKGLINTGKVIRADGLYRAAQPVAQPQERVAA